MTIRYYLKEDTELYGRLLQLEELFRVLEIGVESYGNTFIIDQKTGKRYMVGLPSDREPFPRTLETLFYLQEDE